MIGIKRGDRIRIKTFNQVIKEYPDANWSYSFFSLNANRITRVINFDIVAERIKCEFIHPHNGNKKVGYIDMKAMERLTNFGIPETLFEL